jgi:hypothetical protein
MKLLSSILTTASLVFTAHALGAGKVCMFNAPSGAYTLGHVGWGYLVGGTSTWVYGATEEPGENWHTSGSWPQMLASFKDSGDYHNAGYYLYYKCQTSPTSAVGAANKQVAAGEASGYNWDNDNCLSKAVAIFEAYDGSTFDYLGNGKGWPPNFYFDNELSGFSQREDL